LRATKDQLIKFPRPPALKAIYFSFADSEFRTRRKPHRENIGSGLTCAVGCLPINQSHGAINSRGARNSAHFISDVASDFVILKFIATPCNTDVSMECKASTSKFRDTQFIHKQ